MNADQIVRMLATKHDKDVFVPECKNGPSQTAASHRRMDAWAMRKSWAKPMVWAYEVKVSRSDFLRDDKWHEYLECCNELYFVCPHQLISVDEVPQQAGLIWVSKTGSRLFTKKKSPTRAGPIPEDVFRYILMSRATIGRSDFYHQSDREYWEKWLEHKRLDYEFGRRVSFEISKRIKEEIDNVQRNNKHLKREIEALEYLRDRMMELGLNPYEQSSYRINAALEQITESVPRDLQASLRNVLRELPRLAEKLGVEQ